MIMITTVTLYRRQNRMRKMYYSCCKNHCLMCIPLILVPLTGPERGVFRLQSRYFSYVSADQLLFSYCKPVLSIVVTF
jgi:hypothetical protein